LCKSHVCHGQDEQQAVLNNWPGVQSQHGLGEEQKVALLWAMQVPYLPGDVRGLEGSFIHHVELSLARYRGNCNDQTAFHALALSVRDRLLERWKATQKHFFEADCKRVAYLSMEFLLGRSLQNATYNLGLHDNYAEALRNLGFRLEDLVEEENDAGLGVGGLGRLAACFMDSLASLDLPAWGYGLRYSYGMFHQEIQHSEQIEFPDFWLVAGNPWELERMDVCFPVKFYGRVEERDGVRVWVDTDDVVAMAYDTPIPGYDTLNALNIRLWSAKPSMEFDLERFNKGNFMESVKDRQHAEQITQVLYPNDSTFEGKELRLKQQYFFVSATLQDLLRRFRRGHRSIRELPDKLAIQLNDTHPALAVVELMRYLLDYEKLRFDEAWNLVHQTFAYTNHTVLPEALEMWDVPLLERLLPRHMEIIYLINYQWLLKVDMHFGVDTERTRTMSIIEEGFPKRVRMANLAVVCCHTVNGVSKIHSFLLVNDVFKDFYAMFPTKFQNKTNGVTPRRWVQQANPDLAKLITMSLGNKTWLLDWEVLKGLEQLVDDLHFHHLLSSVKILCKKRLAEYVLKTMGITLPTEMLFDVHVKRIHEYKRQLLNILYVIHRYTTIKVLTPTERKARVVPRCVFFGGKAAPGYCMAKRIVKLINVVSGVINADPETSSYLLVVFISDYCVSLAETIIPAADISQHISTAGMEASGTSNMKFAMNGALLLATFDGANCEIGDAIGKANVFMFGTRAEKVQEMRRAVHMEKLPMDSRLEEVLKLLHGNSFGDPKDWLPIIDSISRGNDFYLINADFPEYCEVQERVDAGYRDQLSWMRMSIFSIARSGIFSSDRTILQYAKDIWNVEPVRRSGSTELVSATMQGSLGVSPALLRAPKLKVEPAATPIAAKYVAVASHIELGFDPSTVENNARPGE
jgi:starch phosphorylase